MYRLLIKCDLLNLLCSKGSDDPLIKVWSIHSGQLLATLRGHEGDITDLAISMDNSMLISGSNDNHVRVWDLNTYLIAAFFICDFFYFDQICHTSSVCRARNWNE
jgi:WD40 repeat protein